jgi:hypothetical protein
MAGSLCELRHGRGHQDGDQELLSEVWATVGYHQQTERATNHTNSTQHAAARTRPHAYSAIALNQFSTA